MPPSRRCLIIPMPVSPVERLATHFRNVMHLPDPSSLYVLMGAVAANMIDGSPVWLMLIGAPGCGKSELLNSLLSVPHMVEGADIGSEAAFLSGSPAKDISKHATGGLLRQVGDHGGLILNDFTSILSKPSDKISSIMAVFREAFGGRWTRHIGTEGGRAMGWIGRLALFAGCTSTIDQHQQLSAELGERWIYWRYEQAEDDDGFAQVMMALSDNRKEGWRDTLREAVAKFYSDLGLNFGATLPRRDFTNAENIRIHLLAIFAARCRSSVARDRYTKEIIGAREDELATRLSQVLAQLLLGMEHIGVPAPVYWKLLRKVAMDSMPRLRRLVVDAVATGDMSLEQIRPLLGCSPSVAKRVVEDLEVHQIVLRQSGIVRLTPWAAERYHKL
jgi:energy-coupling factor transporter ATP-binding protein EcfA2